MATNIISDGQQIQVTLSGSVSAGDVWEGTDMIGIYLTDGAAGDVVSVQVGVCEVLVAKTTGTAYTQGQQLYWDATNNKLYTTNTGIPCGRAARAAQSGDATAYLLLNAGPQTT